jgi:exopolysaccharide biosynthesis polyprenyl glycosylphosphotransferase
MVFSSNYMYPTEHLPELKLPLEFSERKLLLRTGDFVLTMGGIIGSLWYWAYESNRAFSWQLLIEQSPWIVAMTGGWLVWMFVNDLYELRTAVKLRYSLQRIFTGSAIAIVLYLIYYFISAPAPLTQISFLPRFAPLAIGIATLFLAIGRSMYAVFLGAGSGTQRVLIFGAGLTGGIIAKVFLQHPYYQLAGFIDDDRQIHGKLHQDVPILGDRHRLLSEINRQGVDEVVLAISEAIDDDLLQLLISCHEQGISVTPMPVLYEKLTGKVAVEHIGSQWYTALPLTKHPFDTLNRVGKRTIDLACGLIIGAILAVVFPFVAIAIKLETPGPIFYEQERVGQYGNKFTVCKFRSMVQDAEINGKAQWAVKGDARITKVGYFIRKTRLDELPQVLNVLRGEMSMVGPRPEREQFIKQLQEQIPFYRTRLAAKPGLTGWAQVNYGYGSTVNDALIKLQYDLYYLKHGSPWLDLKILLRTFAVVLKMQGQ